LGDGIPLFRYSCDTSQVVAKLLGKTLKERAVDRLRLLSLDMARDSNMPIPSRAGSR
jgi:hypothetical protein